MAPTTSVVSAVRVLEAVGAAARQAVDLARTVALPKSTVQRILHTLAEVGWCVSDDTARWRLTYRAFAVGNQARDAGGLRAVALPVLHELQLTTGRPCTWRPRTAASWSCSNGSTPRTGCARSCRWDTASRCTPRPPGRPTSPPVPRRRSTPTSPARWRRPPSHRRRPRPAAGPDRRGPRAWMVGQPRGAVRRHRGGRRPLVGPDGRPVGALSVSGPTVRMTEEVFDDHGRAAADAARRISHDLGARP